MILSVKTCECSHFGASGRGTYGWCGTAPVGDIYILFATVTSLRKQIYVADSNRALRDLVALIFVA